MTFDAAGTYVIALIGDDGEMADGEMLTITVTGGGYVRNESIPDDWETTWYPDQDTPDTVTKDGKDVEIYTVYVWGVNPTDPGSVLGVQALMTETGLDVQINTFAQRSYLLEMCTDLSAEPQVWTSVGNPVTGDGTRQTFTDPSPPDHAMYRIRIEVTGP